MNPHKVEFVKTFNKINRSKHRYDVFRDFLGLAFCALAKTTCLGEQAEKLEAEYMRIVETYKPDNLDIIREAMPKLMGLTQLGLTHRCDFLGEVYHELELHNKEMGQFFTPFALSYTNAKLIMHDLRDMLRDNGRGFITIAEPAAGAGGMILAAAAVFEDAKCDPGKTFWFEATDLSEMAFKMCYIQCALRGLSGRVHWGNTLTMEFFGSYVTPAGVHFVNKHGNPLSDNKSDKIVPGRDFFA